jgi:hypothetical protein
MTISMAALAALEESQEVPKEVHHILARDL